MTPNAAMYAALRELIPALPDPNTVSDWQISGSARDGYVRVDVQQIVLATAQGGEAIAAYKTREFRVTERGDDGWWVR